MWYTATANLRYKVFLRLDRLLLLRVYAAAMDQGRRRRGGWCLAQAWPIKQEWYRGGIITRRLLDEMAGYLCLLPAAGWAMGIHNHGLV